MALLQNDEVVDSAGAGLASVVSTGLSAPTIGSLIVVAVRHGTGTISVADDRGNTYIKDRDAVSSSNRKVSLFHCVNVTSSPLTITVTANAGAQPAFQLGAYFGEWSGYPNAVFDQTASSTATSANPTSGATSARTAASELLIGITSSAGTSVTAVGTNVAWASFGLTQLNAEYFEASVAGTDAATYTLSGSAEWVAVIGTYKTADAVPSAPPARRQAARRVSGWALG